MKTEDGKEIDFQTYSLTCKVCGKGDISTKDVEYVEDLFNRQNKVLNEVMRTIKKLSILYETKETDELQGWMKAEESTAIEKFKKTYKCLTREEHIEIMKHMLNQMNPAIKTALKNVNMPLGYTGSVETLIPRYLNGRHFIEVLKI